MFAVLRTGGKQYKVANGDVIKVERLDGEAGETVTLDDILAVGDGNATTVGTPVVAGASVSAEIVAQGHGPKLRVFKKRRRKSSRTLNGHRQHLTVLRIKDIQASA